MEWRRKCGSLLERLKTRARKYFSGVWCANASAFLGPFLLSADWCGLKFKPPKCATLHIHCRQTRQVLPTQFNIQGGSPVVLKDGEHYKHLGVPTGFRTKQTLEKTNAQVNEDLQIIHQSLLVSWQKMYAVVTFLLPRLDLILREGNVVKRLLYPTEKCFKNSPRNGWTFRSVVGPKCYPFGVLPSLPSQGVAGILLLTDAVNIATVTQGFRMFTCKDPFVSRVAWASLQTVVGREMGGGKPTQEQMMENLNGSVGGNLATRERWRRHSIPLLKSQKDYERNC